MRTSIWILACCLFAAGLVAQEVPAGKAAVAEMVLGKATLHPVKGKDKPLKVGQVLDFGAQVSTGEGGRAFLRLASQAVVRMAPNTQMTLSEPGARKGTFLNLATGFIRYLVGKRAPGEAFEVQTSNAVAAVKGTDAGTQTDGQGETQNTVYDSDHQDAMSVTDPSNGQSQELNPGQTTILDNNGFNTHDLTDQDKQAGDTPFEGLPHPDLGPTPPPQGPETPPSTGDGGGQNAHDKLEEVVQEAMGDLSHDLKVDGNQDSQDRNSDLASGRVGMDRFGVQVRMANNLVRSAPDTVLLSTSSERTSGPNQGITQASLSNQYNQALPDDWLGVLKLSLTDPSNLNQGNPIWYKIQSIFTASNPVGDNLQLTTLFSAPYLDPGNTMTQAYIQDLWAYTPITGGGAAGALGMVPQYSTELYYNVHSSLYAQAIGSIGSDALLLQGPQSGYAYDTTSFYSSPGALAGGVSVPYNADFYSYVTSSYTYYSYFTQTFHILDGQGNVQPLPAFIQDVISGKNYSGIGPLDFTGLDRSLNLETSIDVPGFFKQPIDLLVMPEIFDGMGGILPIFMEPGCNCG